MPNLGLELTTLRSKCHMLHQVSQPHAPKALKSSLYEAQWLTNTFDI